MQYFATVTSHMLRPQKHSVKLSKRIDYNKNRAWYLDMGCLPVDCVLLFEMYCQYSVKFSPNTASNKM